MRPSAPIRVVIVHGDSTHIQRSPYSGSLTSYALARELARLRRPEEGWAFLAVNGKRLDDDRIVETFAMVTQ